MPDLWLTDAGKLHPAAEKIMPEWEDRCDKFRLWYEVPPKSAWRTWRVQVRGRLTLQSQNEWLPCRDCTAHEAAALLEKVAREWLAERGVSVYFDCEHWLVFDSNHNEYYIAHGVWGDWGDAKRFDSYTAAQQAGILVAAKGD